MCLVDTNTVAVHIAYYILQVGFHSRVVPRRKRRDQNSFCNQNKLTLVVRCFGRLCIVHMSMLKDTTSANHGHIYYIGPPILKRSFSFVCTGPFHSEVSMVFVKLILATEV